MPPAINYLKGIARMLALCALVINGFAFLDPTAFRAYWCQRTPALSRIADCAPGALIGWPALALRETLLGPAPKR